MDKLKEVDWRGLYKSATQKVKKYTLNLTDLEIKVEDATNSETWGPHGSVMNEIADASYDPEDYRQIMGVLARRLQEKDENWRMAYKALLLLEHLIKHGPGKIVGDVQSSASVLERLQNFEYKDANMRDHGVNVRHRAKEILQLVNSPDRLREEREKARANRAKYRGVSADQMRSASFGRSTSDRYTSATSGSLFPGGGSSGGSGGGLGGGSSGYAASRRTSSYDETDEGAHYISKRGAATADLDAGAASGTSRPTAAAAAGGASSGAAAGGSGGAEDALAATRARIDRLKLSGAAEERPGAGAEDSKKRLTDVRVNPKIAASLGLKIPAPAPRPASASAAAPAPASAAAGAAGEVDLLGGLEEPPAPAAAPAAAPAPAAGFDPFAAAAAAAPAPAPSAAATTQQAWDAFGAAPVAATAAPQPAGAASPLDLLGGLDFSSAPAPAPAAVRQQPPLPAPAAPADPFAAFTPAPAPAAASSFPMATAPKPAAPAPLPAVAAGVPAALPEDMFSDLTGIGGRSKQPMGQSQQAPAAGGPSGSSNSGLGAGMGWGVAGASPPSPGAGFGSFSGSTLPTAPASAASGVSPGFGGFAGAMPAAAAAQQQPPVGHSRGGSMGAVDFGSFSYSSAQQQGGATAADPFADLLK